MPILLFSNCIKKDTMERMYFRRKIKFLTGSNIFEEVFCLLSTKRLIDRKEEYDSI